MLASFPSGSLAYPKQGLRRSPFEASQTLSSRAPAVCTQVQTVSSPSLSRPASISTLPGVGLQTPILRSDLLASSRSQTSFLQGSRSRSGTPGPSRTANGEQSPALRRDASTEWLSKPRVATSKVMLDPEAGLLRQQLAERDVAISELQQRLEDLSRQHGESSSVEDAREVLSVPAAVAQPNEDSSVRNSNEPANLHSAVAVLREAFDGQQREVKLLTKTVEDQNLQIESLHTRNAEFQTEMKELKALFARVLAVQVDESSAPEVVHNGVHPSTPPPDSMGSGPEADGDTSERIVISPGRNVPSMHRRHDQAGDPVDQRLEEYLTSRPDFQIHIEKVKPGWYIFGSPISKKLYLKVVGGQVLCRIGGGHKELSLYLDEHRRLLEERTEYEAQTSRSRAIQKTLVSSQASSSKSQSS